MWARVPKNHPKYKQRAYINDDGQVISRRQYQKIQNEGITPERKAKERRDKGELREKYKKQRGYNHFVDVYKDKTAAKLGIKRSQVKVRGNSAEAIEFRKNYKRFRKIFDDAEKQRKRRGGKIDDYIDRSPSGELAKIMVELNLRNPEWDMPVGQS